MDKDRVEGKMDDVKGRIKRQVGEWTGDENAQAEGAADQAKGKAQNAWGKIKDAGRDAVDNVRGDRDHDGVRDRDEDVA
jgi:uncharacterized protein YjbJ (UPF0337 family)